MLSLKDELEAALSSTCDSEQEVGGKQEVGGEQDATELQAGERLAESTPRLNDSDVEAVSRLKCVASIGFFRSF